MTKKTQKQIIDEVLKEINQEISMNTYDRNWFKCQPRDIAFNNLIIRTSALTLHKQREDELKFLKYCLKQLTEKFLTSEIINNRIKELEKER